MNWLQTVIEMISFGKKNFQKYKKVLYIIMNIFGIQRNKALKHSSIMNEFWCKMLTNCSQSIVIFKWNYVKCPVEKLNISVLLRFTCLESVLMYIF